MVEKKSYGQFCPVAVAAEVLTERWMPLIIRELLCGSVRFNDLQRGVPRMSPALLSARLKRLQAAGIVEHRSGGEYHLTTAGRELFPVIEQMGLWAQRWLRHDLTAAANLDPNLLMWDIRRNVRNPVGEGERRYVTEFHLSGAPEGRRAYWLVFEPGLVDLCTIDPGFDVDLYVETSLPALTRVWLGHVSIDQAIRDEQLTFDGSRRDVAAFRSWFALSLFARAGREPAGRETRPAAG
ncbi:helix-turn-helix transcriptional regulator [Rhodoblastus acidophilus]|uniref:Helix-turn-helix transcriptional regulator n=1 Tax=Candidatus Rhodoblastus alkanivorans TaxID=2954117 RepID=A0ABS9Z5J2_9HYPH|nr:helix-turn-helix domain-containing protein [Candidatus Rhodoblastus alkanivorans]MCI4679866.1 helix-turn-helix transcriptional regulator [Candidatus Rhodoblastus alkanivorans]MCI4682731.1 helix-turn-helix transcriptional regulator [Candidatus Rhodoblastus alkanivorans]MDI4640038.1 helix-turn-helix transcriptional regulator [Rhodoblastus acidophilus]